MTTTYEALDQRLAELTRTDIGFSQLLCVESPTVADALQDECIDRLSVIREFLDQTLTVFRATLDGEVHPEVLNFLLNDSPAPFREEYYRQLPEEAWTSPHFFRTDEARPGQILEIQAPGSMWGELQLLCESADSSRSTLPSDEFASALKKIHQAPIVHHLLDNASIPHTMRYFIERTRECGIPYYGLSPGVGSGDCNFIRSHSVFGLLAENFFASRLRACAAGDLVFDLPPMLLLDQKAPLALPWWSQTRHHFSDEVREVIAYTTPLTRNGFELPDGTVQSLEDFAAAPQNERAWYLKYAGTDIEINWGSRGVSRLSNNGQARCLRELVDAASSKTRTAWVVQPAIEHRSDVQVLTRAGDVVTESDAHSKFSSFYGPTQHFGSVYQYRGHFKVHGQDDTAIALVAPRT